MSTQSFQRHVARKLSVKDILNARYKKVEGVNPNFLDINGEEVSRVNVVGIVTQKMDAENYSSLFLDDGAETIQARLFENKTILEGVGPGDVVLTIARPREYMDEKYLLIETLKKVDPLWAKVRKKELRDVAVTQEIEVQKVENISPSEEKGPSKVISLIKELDEGEGVSIEELNQKNIEDADKLVDFLLKEGDVFEVRPGRLKVLE